jgi:alpha-ketoglutarate-dependent taurine dioxygenase
MVITTLNLNEVTPETIAEHTNVLVRGVDLTKEKYAEFLQSLGQNPKRDFWFSDKEHSEIMYVTNKELDNGRQGLFARGELEWHCNGPCALDPEDVVSLYCREETNANTSFTNGVAAWEALPSDVKERIDKTFVIISDGHRSFHKLEMDHLVRTHIKPRMLSDKSVYKVEHDAVTTEERQELLSMQSRTRDPNGFISETMKTRKEIFDNGGKWNCVYKRLVHIHLLTGKRGLWFPFYNVVGYDNIPESEWKELHDYLVDHYLKYTYSHKWKSGDLIFFDNTQGLHKRDMIPDGEERELWRGAFWYVYKDRV